MHRVAFETKVKPVYEIDDRGRRKIVTARVDDPKMMKFYHLPVRVTIEEL